MQTARAPRKPKTIAINPSLHRYLKLLTALDCVGLNDLAEPPLWEIVRSNRGRLEQLTGETIEVPDFQQCVMPLEGGK